MRFVQTISIASTTLALIGSVAFAQEMTTGLITQIDRLNGTISIQQSKDGTVGSSSGTAIRYKVKGPSLEELHAGDEVSFSASRNGDVDTVTKIEKRRSNVVK